MKSYKIQLFLIGLLMISFSSCSDFFSPDNDTTLRGEDYIKENSEVYSGFLGIITKMQVIGDKAIYLTDMRGELLEPTTNTPEELYSIYNYDDDLTGNSYADPAKYYDVIIACNDYLQKAKEFKEKSTTLDHEDYKKLVSSALRVKVWVYLTIVKIYGEAIWFDDPLQSMKDITNLEPKSLSEILDACETLLNTGYDGVDGTYDMNWGGWLNPSETTVTDEHKRWNMMVPGHFVLQAEISLWKGEYEKAARLILGEMSRVFDLPDNKGSRNYVRYMRTGSYNNAFGEPYDAASPVITATESVIMYDYKYNQQNGLLKHFDRSGGYMLRASVVGAQRFMDVTFNPSNNPLDIKNTSDRRFNAIQEVVVDEEYAIRKYRGFSKSGHTVAHDDVHIMIYHIADLYFMAVEALNNMGRYEPAEVLLNKGMDKFYTSGVELGEQWLGLDCNWELWRYDRYNRPYADQGIRPAVGVGVRDFWQTADDINHDEEGLEGLTDDQKIKKHNDLELVKEYFLEFPCEGKTYPFMIRVAKRWNDYSFIARYVSEKYTDPSMQETVKNKILNGAYFVPWDLKSKSTSH